MVSLKDALRPSEVADWFLRDPGQLEAELQRYEGDKCLDLANTVTTAVERVLAQRVDEMTPLVEGAQARVVTAARAVMHQCKPLTPGTETRRCEGTLAALSEARKELERVLARRKEKAAQEKSAQALALRFPPHAERYAWCPEKSPLLLREETAPSPRATLSPRAAQALVSRLAANANEIDAETREKLHDAALSLRLARDAAGARLTRVLAEQHAAEIDGRLSACIRGGAWPPSKNECARIYAVIEGREAVSKTFRAERDMAMQRWLQAVDLLSPAESGPE